MKLSNVKINCYKSFGKEYNNFQVEDDITAIIGTNESGKSNLLEILSKVSLLNGIEEEYLNEINRKYEGEKVSLILKFKLSNDEIKKIIKELEIDKKVINSVWNKLDQIICLLAYLYTNNSSSENVFNKLDDKTTCETLKKIDYSVKNLIDLIESLKEEEKEEKENIDFIKDWLSICVMNKLNDDFEIQFDESLESELRTFPLKNIEGKYITEFGSNFKQDEQKKFFEKIESIKLDFKKNNNIFIEEIIEKLLYETIENLRYTSFILEAEKSVKIGEGAFKYYFESNLNLKNKILKLKEKINLNKENVVEKYKILLTSLELLDSKIFSEYVYYLKELENDYKNHNEVCKLIHYIREKIDFIYNFMPIFYLYKDKDKEELKDIYRCSPNFIENSNNASLINSFFKIINIDKKELNILNDEPETGKAEDLKRNINVALKKHFENEFNKFYNQEKIEFYMSFNNSFNDKYCSFSIFIDSTGNYMKISERSNGLRWYLSMFIDIKSKNLNNKDVIYLIDEPAVFLHVRAQKEVLNLFKSLTKNNNNQLIYTTHSPYMIDSKDYMKIRAIKKEDGISKIYNKAYNAELSNKSKMEILTPFLDAIGLDLKYNLGPQSDMLNIVTEGITDYMYISAMINYLGIEDVYILPSVGAQNEHNLVSILIGWGMDFKALFDYDNEGYKASEELKKLGLEVNKDYYFLNGEEKFEKNGKDEKQIEQQSIRIEDLISKNDRDKIQKLSGNTDKTIIARIFKTEVENNTIELDDETIKNFKNLFKIMGIYQ